jgi:hypothetical protein
MSRAKASGIHSGLDAPSALVTTPDGRGLIAAVSDDDAIADFDREPAPVCSDGLDNDSDGKTDHPEDPGCTGPADQSELDPPDTTAPSLRLSGKRTQRSDRRVIAKATVDERARVTVKQRGKVVIAKGRGAAVSAKVKVRFKRVSRNLGPDQRKRFKLKPKRRGDRRKLKKLLDSGAKETVRSGSRALPATRRTTRAATGSRSS